MYLNDKIGLLNLIHFKRLILPLFFSFLLSYSFGQNKAIQFSNITTEDGLSVNAVTRVFQDSQGFMWLATYNGLNRYDGYNIKIFLPEASNPKSISNHAVLQICQDRLGYIWVGTMDGLNRFDPKTEQFVRYYTNKNDPKSLSQDYIQNIYEDSDGTLWIGTSNGLNKYNRQKNNFDRIHLNKSHLNIYDDLSITGIQEDSEKNLWLSTWQGLIHIDKKGNIIKYYKNIPGNKNSPASNRIRTIFLDKNEIIWLGTNGEGVDRFDYKKETFTHYKASEKNKGLADNDVRVLYKDSRNNFWIGTRNGLNLFDPVRNEFANFLHNQLIAVSLINNEIYSIIEDKTGLLWIATAGGVSRCYLSENKFYTYLGGDDSDATSSIRVNSLALDNKNNIWAATKEGFAKIDHSNKQIKFYKQENGKTNTLINNYVKSVIEDHTGTLWLGTDGGGLSKFNPVTGKYTTLSEDDSDTTTLSNNGVPSLLEDSKGNLWAGTYYGLNLFNRSKGNFKRIKVDPTGSNSVKNGILWVLYEDSKGFIWIGTDGGGVSRFDPGNFSFTNFYNDSSKSNTIIGNRVFAVYESKDGLLWFGTTQGLSCYDRNSGKFVSYTQENGLASNAANSIVEDNKGYIWISTDKGLSRLNRKTKKINNYTKRNGLSETEFSPNAVLKDEHGHLYFGSSSGIIYFNPEDIKDDMTSAPVIFTDLKIYNQSVPISTEGETVLTESITGSKNISIPHNNDFITIEFSLLDYFNAKTNTYAYKLEGFDTHWNNIGRRNTATYTNLPPGEYTFIVRAYNGNGVRTENEARIGIIIIPEYYHTWWFKVLMALAALLVTFIVFQARTRSIKKQNKNLEIKIAEHTKSLDNTISELSLEVLERKKAEEKVQASLLEKEVLLKEKEVLLKEIHHRVKNNLQIISSLLYLNSKKIKHSEATNLFQESQNRVKSIALVHERLYQSKDLGKIDFNDYVQKLTNDLFRSYAVNQSVIGIDINIKDIYINIDTAVPCGLIINELISNSLKYAFPNYEEENKTGLIKILFSSKGEKEYCLEVSDDGVGIKEDLADKKRYSLGLQLVDSLVTQLEGKLELDSSSGMKYKFNFFGN